jgi:hypothetical protein
MPVVSDLFEKSRRRTWPFHILLWNFFKRTINITEYRNAKDDVNPAKIERLATSFMINLSSIYWRCRVIYSRLACAGRFQSIRAKTCSRAAKKYEGPRRSPVVAAALHAIVVRLAARSVGASPAAPLGGIRQHEQVQTAEQEQGEREHRQEAQPRGIFPLYHGDDVEDDGHRKGHGQPAVGLPNPFVPVQ